MNTLVEPKLHLPFVILAPDDMPRRATDQCDCACADTCTPSFALDTVVLTENTPYQRAPNATVTPLTGGWHMAHQPMARRVPLVLNQACFMLWRAFERERTLSDVTAYLDLDAPIAAEGMRLLVGHDLLQSSAAPWVRVQTTANTLTVWLHITNACNLRCSYCYLRKTTEHMSLETGQRALDTIFRTVRRHGYSKVQLKYAGGEATTNLLLVLRLQEYALRLAARDGIELDAVVLSNGTLLDAKRIAQLQASALRLMISLDGIGAAHDAQRRFIVKPLMMR